MSRTVTQNFLSPDNVGIYKISNDSDHVSQPDKNKKDFIAIFVYTFETRATLATLTGVLLLDAAGPLEPMSSPIK